ncbi:ArsR/SmtB family transcription factor [Limosilactobacillus secaliphilus]|uniref:HTH arsR-type domain-containing protein n=1 Tax=Limosilactobacillus secaliphilus TaxID=396268 RepID=A0A0R2I3L9_9LACO|nr:metalloregulator ArsR/SmtB family transcription factor [Limosilactobacillus secaliphilus]KRN58182.1 hypothetical protein IV45_GL000625 [Limosilactobacillus secaliphilus]
MEIPSEQIEEAAKIYGVLSNSIRIKILYFLYYQENDVPVNEIVHELGLSQPVVSRQLAILRQYQLVRFHREGKQVFYVVDDPHVVEMINDMLNHVKHEIKGLPHPKQ